MDKQTSYRIASLAGTALRTPERLSLAEWKEIAGSALSQAHATIRHYEDKERKGREALNVLGLINRGAFDHSTNTLLGSWVRESKGALDK